MKYTVVRTFLELKSSIFLDITPCSPFEVTDVSEEHVASIFRVEQYSKQETTMESMGSACYLLRAGFLLGLFSDPEDGGDMFFRNIG
jgi:hypothetical protein